MAFSQATITEVMPPKVSGRQVYLSWSSSSPAGTIFQVYINQQLTWSGQRRWTWVPIPAGPQRIDIGTVDADEGLVDFSAFLPAAPIRRVTLSWQSGPDAAGTLAGFKVYGSSTPGGPISYTTPLATITAYPADIRTDGFGFAGFGAGGFGRAPGTYAWTSAPLAAGSWSFAIISFDVAGNTGTPYLTTVAVLAPPREPGLFSDGVTRLEYALDSFGQVGFGAGGFGMPAATLTWNASPS